MTHDPMRRICGDCLTAYQMNHGPGSEPPHNPDNADPAVNYCSNCRAWFCGYHVWMEHYALPCRVDQP